MATVVLHGPHVFEAAVHLADVGLDFVAAVSLEDDEGRSHPPVTHPGYGASPHLHTDDAIAIKTQHHHKIFRVMSLALFSYKMCPNAIKDVNMLTEQCEKST